MITYRDPDAFVSIVGTVVAFVLVAFVIDRLTKECRNATQARRKRVVKF